MLNLIITSYELTTNVYNKYKYTFYSLLLKSVLPGVLMASGKDLATFSTDPTFFGLLRQCFMVTTCLWLGVDRNRNPLNLPAIDCRTTDP